MARLRRVKDVDSELFPGFSEVTEIGVGSLATVFRAREAGTNRSVALKLLHVGDAPPRALEPFEREAAALGAVSSHPNIVTLYRCFRTADGRPVLALQLCRGALSDRMRDGHGLPVAEVVAIGIKIAGALETAHGAGILHRDVKPQNILITEFGEPALADFGVASLQSSTQTTAGLFDFTTLHAAPELLEGGPTGPATDVYELASSLYQLIAGRSAFRAKDGESPASVILRILRDPVQPLVGVDVPAQLSDLLVRAMSKEKDRRPPTAAEFAAELAAVEAAQGWAPTEPLTAGRAAPGAFAGAHRSPAGWPGPVAQQPIPGPGPMPVPGPAPLPAPMPTPEPMPTPGPMPTPEPMPTPGPMPNPEPMPGPPPPSPLPGPPPRPVPGPPPPPDPEPTPVPEPGPPVPEPGPVPTPEPSPPPPEPVPAPEPGPPSPQPPPPSMTAPRRPIRIDGDDDAAELTAPAEAVAGPPRPLPVPRPFPAAPESDAATPDATAAGREAPAGRRPAPGPGRRPTAVG